MPDVMPRETARQIDAAAAAWAARLDRGDLSASEENELDQWLAADPRRAGAFAKARAVALYTERARALGPHFDARKFQPSTPAKTMSRRTLLWGGSAIAAGLGAAITTGYIYTSRGEDYTTQRGQMKVIPLADGSVVSLNTASSIKVSYTKALRTITLIQGEALFDVAKDALRPFQVLAGDAQVFAIGTSFVVRHLADAPIEVLVREGVVEVNKRAHNTPGVRLSSNMRAVTAPEAQSPVKVVAATAPDEIRRAMAWREGRVIFQGETLRQAVAEFQRYSDTRILIDDDTIAAQAVTGLFQVNDPIGFAQAVATSFGLHAEVGDKQVRLYR
jgi:transmembrane sensor